MCDYVIALWGAWPAEPPDQRSLQGCRVVVSDGRDAGCVTIIPRPDHLWLDELYVAPWLQSRGVGSQVLHLILLEAASEQLPIRLSVLTTNPAFAFYRRHGFRVDRETEERRYLTNGQPGDLPRP